MTYRVDLIDSDGDAGATAGDEAYKQVTITTAWTGEPSHVKSLQLSTMVLRFRGIPRQVQPGRVPDPATGQFIAVEWYDNLDPVNTATTWDSNGDGIMWMVAQAGVGKRATRMISEVERTWFTMSLPRGIPLWARGNLLSNGGGNNPKIEVEVPPPSEITTTVHVGGYIEETDVSAMGIVQKTGGDIDPLDEVFPQALVDALVSTAKANGRCFTSLASAQASPSNAITGNTLLNSQAMPGILLILGGRTLEWGGNGQFYGVIYSEGPMSTSHGTADIHGMVVTNDTEDMRGTPNIPYNDDCIANLDQRFPSLVRRIQNTWREVQPQ